MRGVDEETSLATQAPNSQHGGIEPTLRGEHTSRLRDYLFLGVLSVIVFLPALGQERQWANRELRHAEIIREMAFSGDYLVPTLLGEVYYEKPAVMHAVAAWLTRRVGESSMWIARLPSAVAAMVTVLATYRLGRLFFERRTALWSGCVLLGLPGFGWMAREARPDMILCMAIVLACLAFGLGMRESTRSRRTLWFGAAGLAAGLGAITKGPFGLMFPLLFVGLAPFSGVRWTRPRWGWLAFFVCFVAAVSVWAVPAYLRDGGHYLHHVITQPDLDPSEGGSDSLHLYLVWLLVLNLPLTLLLPVAIHDLRHRGYSAPLAMVGSILAIVMMIPKKRRHYLLPAYPFLALSLGSTITHHLLINPWVRRMAWTLVPLGMMITPAYFAVVLPLTKSEEPMKRLVSEVTPRIDASADVYVWKPLAEPLAWVSRRHEHVRILGDDDALYTRDRHDRTDKHSRQGQRSQRMLADIRAARPGSYLLLPAERFAMVREDMRAIAHEEVASFSLEQQSILLIRLH
jgi:4-amino-4-deoxy-L-arabinose transferase-like glycosyltransferase